MARAITAGEARELEELWGQLLRLREGIGGWVITAATFPPDSPAAIDADDRIRAATEEAVQVKGRIGDLTRPLTPTARHPAPAAPPTHAVARPRASPVTSGPITLWPAGGYVVAEADPEGPSGRSPASVPPVMVPAAPAAGRGPGPAHRARPAPPRHKRT